MLKKKIMAILPSVVLYGKERSNIEVYRLLNNNPNIELTILLNNKANNALKHALAEFRTYNLKIPVRTNKSFRIFKYIAGVIKSNIMLCYYLIKIRPDVIFINSEMTIYDFFLILYIVKIEIVYRIGDIPAYPQLMAYRLNSFMWNKIVVNKMSKIVSISNFIKSEVDNTGRCNNNDCVIYNYPPHRVRSCGDFEIAFKSASSLKVGYLGQILALKGVHVLLDAALDLVRSGKDVEFVFGGDLNIDSSYTNLLMQKLTATEHDKRVQFVGEIDNIESFFNQIDVLCVPTIWPEALGNVLVEAKKYKKPIIIFPSGGMPELIVHLESGYVCNDKTSKELVKAIEYYLDNREQLDIQSTNSFNSLNQLGITYSAFNKRWLNVFGINNV